MLFSCKRTLCVLLLAFVSPSSASPRLRDDWKLERLVAHRANPEEFRQFFSDNPVLSEAAGGGALLELARSIKNMARYPDDIAEFKAAYIEVAQIVTRYFFSAESDQQLILAVFRGELQTVKRLATTTGSTFNESACLQALSVAEAIQDTAAIQALTNINSQLTFSPEACDQALYDDMLDGYTGSVQALTSPDSKLVFTDNGIYLALRLAASDPTCDRKLDGKIEVLEMLLHRFFSAEEQLLVRKVLSGNIKDVQDLIAKQPAFSERACGGALFVAFGRRGTEEAATQMIQALVSSQLDFSERISSLALSYVIDNRLISYMKALLSSNSRLVFNQETQTRAIRGAIKDKTGKEMKALVSKESKIPFSLMEEKKYELLEEAVFSINSQPFKAFIGSDSQCTFTNEKRNYKLLELAIKKRLHGVVEALISRGGQLTFSNVEINYKLLKLAVDECFTELFEALASRDSKLTFSDETINYQILRQIVKKKSLQEVAALVNMKSEFTFGNERANSVLLELAINNSPSDTQALHVPIDDRSVQTVWALIGPSKLVFRQNRADKALELAAKKPNRSIFFVLLSQDGIKFIFSEQGKQQARKLLSSVEEAVALN